MSVKKIYFLLPHNAAIFISTAYVRVSIRAGTCPTVDVCLFFFPNRRLS
jgi:hypothetical protein